jgi:xanthine dehydrogenase accessory factor
MAIDTFPPRISASLAYRLTYAAKLKLQIFRAVDQKAESSGGSIAYLVYVTCITLSNVRGLALPDIFEEIARIRRERSSASLATVVSGEKGVPGKTGFKMLVYPDGTSLGTVGGGLLESKVREEALRCLHEKTSRLLEFKLDEQSAAGIGALCGGNVKVFVEPILATSAVYIFGGGHIALPLVEFAKVLEFTVVVVDDREEFANVNRFPKADEVKLGDFVEVTKSIDFHVEDSVVIVTHEHQHDEVVLKECLSKKTLPGYIGMIGSKAKVAATFSNLKQQGLSEQLLARVSAPIGLDIGARTPAEIALSIMAEIIAHKYGRTREKPMRE